MQRRRSDSATSTYRVSWGRVRTSSSCTGSSTTTERRSQRHRSSTSTGLFLWYCYLYRRCCVTWVLITVLIIIINNNNSKTMFIVLSSWQSHCESSPVHLMNVERRQAAADPRPSQLDDLGCESACTGCQSLHPPSPFIIITQPESWYSFYRPTEGRRLSQFGFVIG